MAFYSTQDYLAAEARKSQMQLRGQTPPPRPGVTHPPEHERTRMQSLLDSIPETQPGPNAFALQAAILERQRAEGTTSSQRHRRGESVGEEFTGPKHIHIERRSDSSSSKQESMRARLESHPAYQREVQRRRVTPPTDIHPAFRGRSVSDPPTPPPPRASTCTNMTDFMKAGMEVSPKLKLNATPNPASVPTFRDRVEHNTEHVEHERPGSEDEKVPVFRPTPKMPASKDFAQRPGTPADGLQKEDSGSKLPVKTPKKSIFSKFKLSTNSRTANSSSASNPPEDPASQYEEKVPVKVQAVLGESPRKPKRVSLGASPTKIPRSPSKRKNFFSRKNADVTETARPSTSLAEYQRPPDTPSTVISDGQQTAISDPVHYSYQERPVLSKHQSEKANGKSAKEVQKFPMMTRSQSVRLGFYDGAVPPTPPAKNTPPHVKAMKESKEVAEMQQAMKMSTRERQHILEDEEEEGIASTTDRISPAKFGSYGYRNAPTLVTKPSMYSLHASVVPDLMEASTLEEMNARVGALDLEGFSMPAEKLRRSHIATAVYSPSVYSTAGFASPGATPMLMTEDPRASNTLSAHTKDSSSNGTIPIFYPELASDPSVVKRANVDANRESNDHSSRGRTHLSPELTWHGRTHSRDHLDGDRQSLFAHHVDNEEQRRSMYNSPSAFSHTSAMPSPLQYLPATVYTPPPKKEKKRRAMQTEADMSKNQNKTPEMREAKPVRGSGLGIENDGAASPTNSPISRHRDIFQTKPSLSATGGSNPASQIISRQPIFNDPTNLDPQKPFATPSTPSDDKFDQMMDMLSKLNSRNGDLVEMRDEMRASMARLDQRLSGVESQHRASPPLTPSTWAMSGSLTGSEGLAREGTMRVPTDVAHEFYRSAQVAAEQSGLGRSGEQEVGSGDEQETGSSGRPQREGDVGRSSDDSGGVAVEGEYEESETITELREQNQKLLEIVGGFADKIQALEAKMKRGSG